MRGPIEQNAGKPYQQDGIEYELFQAGQQVVVSFINRTNAPLRLSEASVLIDSTGRSFAVEEQLIDVNQSGRVILPPTDAVERSATAARPAVADIEPRVGGIDEGGLITPNAQRRSADVEPIRGFRWRDGQSARAQLVFEPQPAAAVGPATGSSAPATAAATQPRGVQHTITLRRTR